MSVIVDYKGHEIKVNKDLQLIVDGKVQDESKAVIGIPFLSGSRLNGEIEQGELRGTPIKCEINYTGFSERVSIYVNNNLIKQGKLKYGLNGIK